MRRRAWAGSWVTTALLVVGCSEPASETTGPGPPASAQASATDSHALSESDPTDPPSQLAPGTFATVESCNQFLPTDPPLLGSDPVAPGDEDDPRVCAYVADRDALSEGPPPPYIGVDFRLIAIGGARDYNEMQTLFQQSPDLLAVLPGETVLSLEEVKAPGWTYAFLTEGRVDGSDVDIVTASLVFVTESVDLTCSAHLSFPGVTADWVRREIPSLRAYCGSVKKTLRRP